MNPVGPSPLHAFVPCLAEALERRFPKHCTCCGYAYPTLDDYYRRTTPLGGMCFDTSDDRSVDPIGTVSLANCACGTTLALECGERDADTYVGFVASLEREAAATDTTVEAAMTSLRGMIVAYLGARGGAS